MYKIGNLMFILIECTTTFCTKSYKSKYVACSHSGIFINNIFTEEEILAAYPDIEKIKYIHLSNEL